MSISEAYQKIKTYITFVEKRDIYGAFLIFFVAMCSFALGRLSVVGATKTPVTVENLSAVYSPKIADQASGEVVVTRDSSQNSSDRTQTSQTGNYVASKSGKRFYLPTCSGVKRINEANKVWFDTKEDAQAAGYTPATNCDGI